jgi:hypothetical protein
MVYYPWIKCSLQEDWGTWFGMAIFGTILYVVGIPLGLAMLLFLCRHKLDNADVKVWFGFFYYTYKRKFFWYEMVITCRRLLIALAISLSGTQSSVLPLVMFLVLSTSIWFHTFLMPYKSFVVNMVEVCSLFMSLFIFVGGLIFSSSTMVESFKVVEVVLITGNVLFFCGLVAVLFFYLRAILLTTKITFILSTKKQNSVVEFIHDGTDEKVVCNPIEMRAEDCATCTFNPPMKNNFAENP